MKFEAVTKLNKRNKATPKIFYKDVISANCDVIVIFRIYGQFEAIQKLDSGCLVYETCIFFNSNLLSYKNWKQN